MSKDAFQILADEFTLMRGQMDRLQRTSLDKDDAAKLHDSVTKAVLFLEKTTKAAPGEIHAALKADRDQMAQSATQAATEAAERVMTKMRHDLNDERFLTDERLKYSEATRKAIRSKWLLDGELATMLFAAVAVGVGLGALAMAGIQAPR